MLIASDIQKSFGSRVVLHGMSFDIPRGQITGLLGPNGAGKTTLLHILVGLIEPSSGFVFLDGDDRIAADFTRDVGFCADDLPLPELLTGREYLDMVTGIRGLRRRPGAESRLLAGMRLDDAASRLIETYSHGMKRKLQLVAALLHSPSYLVLDEPFRGLDPESSAIMKNLLRTYAARGNGVLISTHDLLVAEQLCTGVLILREGRLLSSASAAELRHADDGATLEESFLRLTGLDASSERSAELFFDGLDLLTAPGLEPE
ncbi:MAG: transporter ATP-binding protein [Microbacteriaceae bacterium]|jgi:ABC-2 type transport system ATP-binding protein|nr:transporter ATP-binding protein [Microbacteriaceae bacterium]